MNNQQNLQQPIINGSLRVTNFFNGRLVTGADMTREQNARREAVSRIGQAAGEGIAYGLEVEKNASDASEPIVNVSSGLAVNRCGQALFLPQNTTVNLMKRFGTIEQASKIFGDCKPLAVGTYTAGDGLYLLVLSPAESSEGSAPTSGLNNAFSTCNTDVILETVQFRLLAIDQFLKVAIDQFLKDKLLGTGRLRNYIAYRCFGTEETQSFFKNPLGFPLTSYGLMDEMRENKLSDSDVPLAIIHWTSSGIQFVEMWAVRRRLTKRYDDAAWTQLIDDRRMSESEAMTRQFADQIESLKNEKRNLRAIKAKDYFRFLPPAGLLPVASSGASTGFDLDRFFELEDTEEFALLEGSRLRSLLNESLAHEPIDMDTNEKLQLYIMRENLEAIMQGQNVQLALIFARRSLPYYGIGRLSRSHLLQLLNIREIKNMGGSKPTNSDVSSPASTPANIPTTKRSLSEEVPLELRNESEYQTKTPATGFSHTPVTSEPEQPVSQIDLEIQLLLDKIPIAHEGHIITSEYHNTMRDALLTVANRMGPTVKAVSDLQVLNFAPNFQKVENTVLWTVSFNKAVIPQVPEASTVVKGSFPVRLPDYAVIDSMIVRGSRVTTDKDRSRPKTFTVNLSRQKFDTENPQITPLIKFDLADKKEKIKEANDVKESLPDDLDQATARSRTLDLSRVNNQMYQYFIEAIWEGDNSLAKFEIYSFQIYCGT